MFITRAHLLTTNNCAAVLRKKIEYLQLKSVTDTRYGGSEENRTPVRKSLLIAFYERRQFFVILITTPAVRFCNLYSFYV